MTKYPTDPATIDAITEFRIARGMTNEQLGKLFGVSATFISKYLNDKMDRDPEDFAARVADTLHSIAARLDLPSTIYENFLTAEFESRVNLARQTQDVAFIFGPAGIGKTCACLNYVSKHPTTIYTKITGRSSCAADVEAAVFASMKSTAGHKANQRRWPFMVTAMKGDGGAIIIDNAHRLDRSGRDWCFDFNEETGKAIVFVGNPEMEAKVISNDQQGSRIGGKWEASWVIDAKRNVYHKQLASMASKIAAQFSDPEFAAEISDLAAFVAGKEGHFRSLRKTVITAYKFAAASKTTPQKAFRDAHRNQVRNYMLPPSDQTRQPELVSAQ